MTALRAWCATRFPDLVSDLHRLAETCLLHFRGKGTTRASWYATVQAWVSIDAKWRAERAANGTARNGRRPSAVEQAAEMAKRWEADDAAGTR